MSVKFLGVSGPNQIGSIKKNKTAQVDKKPDSAQQSDQVKFSSVLQDVNKAQASSTESSERTERVAKLKAQIAEGSYKPDLNKVASNLLQFLMEDK